MAKGMTEIVGTLERDLREARRRSEDLDALREDPQATPTGLHEAYCDLTAALMDHMRLASLLCEEVLRDEWRRLGALALEVEGDGHHDGDEG